MNIWFVSKYASPPKFAKAPSRLFFLAKEAKNLGHNIHLITSDSNHFTSIPHSDKTYNYDVQDGVDITWIKTKKYKKTASFERILSWIDFEFKLFLMPIVRMKKPEVVIVSSLSIFTIFYGYYLKFRFKSFLIFEIRDIWPLTLIEEGGFSKWHPLSIIIGFTEKFGYRNSDLIVGTMPKLNIHVAARISESKQVFCSPLGFDPKNYLNEDLSINNPFNHFKSNDKMIVGYAGSMGITNGLDTFIETIKCMGLIPNIQFLIVGSGDLKNEYESELQNNANVVFLPRIQHDQVKYFLEACDILYLSTKNSRVWDFGQSMNKVVEYMLAAKPIVASYNGFPSMINEANCGIFLNSEDPIVLKNTFLSYAEMTPEKREEIGENGRKWIFENRTYKKLAYDYLEVISKFKSTN